MRRTVHVDDEPTVLWDLANRTSHTRFPVLEDGRVVGVVNIMDALRAGRTECPSVRKLMQPPTQLVADLPLRRGLTELQHRKAALAVVIDDQGEPLGVVTAKDLVEPITGELVSW